MTMDYDNYDNNDDYEEVLEPPKKTKRAKDMLTDISLKKKRCIENMDRISYSIFDRDY